MAFSARRTRQGTSASFWRNHNLLHNMMVGACVTSTKPVPTVASPSHSQKSNPTPAWMPTAAQLDRYQARRAAFTASATR